MNLLKAEKYHLNYSTRPDEKASFLKMNKWAAAAWLWPPSLPLPSIAFCWSIPHCAQLPFYSSDLISQTSFCLSYANIFSPLYLLSRLYTVLFWEPRGR